MQQFSRTIINVKACKEIIFPELGTVSRTHLSASRTILGSTELPTSGAAAASNQCVTNQRLFRSRSCELWVQNSEPPPIWIVNLLLQATAMREQGSLWSDLICKEMPQIWVLLCKNGNHQLNFVKHMSTKLICLHVFLEFWSLVCGLPATNGENS